jgi:hypothetical protein
MIVQFRPELQAEVLVLPQIIPSFTTFQVMWDIGSKAAVLLVVILTLTPHYHDASELLASCLITLDIISFTYNMK